MLSPFSMDPFFSTNYRLRSFFPLFDEIERMEDELWSDKWLNQRQLNSVKQQEDRQKAGKSMKQIKDEKSNLNSGKNSKESKESGNKESEGAMIEQKHDNSGNQALTTNNANKRSKDDWLSSLWNGFNVNEDIELKLEDQRNKYLLSASLPNFDKSHLKLTVKDGLLTVSGEQIEEKKDEHSYSKSSKFVSRSMRVPENVDEDSISAKYENGTLNVSLPKLEKPKEKRDTIMIE